LLCLGLAASASGRDWSRDWTDEELKILRSLWIGSLQPLPPDPTNRVADDARAADFGHMLFFDTRLSANSKVSCASCHLPERAFTDGRKRSEGIGRTARNAPTVIGTAYNPWFFWDGRKDSQWSQALGPLEDPLEHGMRREWIVDLVRRDPSYARRYRALFGELPAPGDAAGATRAFVNLGKAIAAYERRLLPGPSKFDRYVEALLAGREPATADRFTLDEFEGLRAFIALNQAQCIRCHSGPLFTDHAFHNIGVAPQARTAGEPGRMKGEQESRADEFGCLSAYRDGPASACERPRTDAGEKTDPLGAFKTPTLRNVSKTGPYMHAGQLERLNDVIWHYRTTPPAAIGRSELNPITLAPSQFDQIEAFLMTLDSPVAAPAKYLRMPVDD